MGNSNGPLIVRHNPTVATPPAKPGLHSHNRTRRMPSATPEKAGPVSRLRTFLLIVGICALGYYGYSASNQYIYQAYQNWAFDQQIAGRKVAFADYLREKTPFGFLVGTRTAEPTRATAPAAPSEGALLGRVEISRLNVSAMVREGVDDKTLSLAVGHVPSTALPGQVGNFAIAAHRDTLFRALKDIRKNDLVTFQSPTGSYTYQVLATEIVKPSEVSVLQPDGGGLIAPPANPKNPEKLLTMITCYPFYYVGSAPKRFIVEAKLVSSDRASKLSGNEAQNTGPPATVPTASEQLTAKPTEQALTTEPRRTRGSSRLGSSPRRSQSGSAPSTRQTRKRRGFWHRLLHV
jgi:sortase A